MMIEQTCRCIQSHLLLLERSPGREAYPGDVFYLAFLSSERASRLSEKTWRRIITALLLSRHRPVTYPAYIPTNVISITDGQIFLESHLFFSQVCVRAVKRWSVCIPCRRCCPDKRYEESFPAVSVSIWRSIVKGSFHQPASDLG